jgi:hypothetical protein
MTAVLGVVREVISKSEVHWAGSYPKSTAIVGSDLDMCVRTTEPVTLAQRRDIRTRLEAKLARQAIILSHVVRMPASGGAPKVDVAFANAAFGARVMPDGAEFHNLPARQLAARALKIWTRGGNLPKIPGWAIEALVVHLDAARQPDGLVLFTRIVGWLETSATPAAVESFLRHANAERWNPVWSARLAGSLIALENHARALRRRPPPEGWKNTDDVGRWLGQ